ncbi:MAG: SpoIIIAH-like family protein [Clostridia bacterium]|nr:SpoIIIAH-like family protein [Clostridia bacterium]
MKKAKKGKAQITLAVMVVALAAAIGLNMKYSTEQESQINTSSKYLGQAEYVNAEVNSVEAETEDEDDYFKTLRSDRNKTRQETIDTLEELIDRTDIEKQEKQNAIDKLTAITLAAEQEASIETVLKAKGYKNVVAVIGEQDINIIIDKNPDAAGVQQIQDAVLSKTSFTAADIKIISSNENS